MDVLQLVLIAAAALVAGGINAIAGGGSLVTFPVLLASGLPAVTASMTNTVAMCPGYLGATLAQRRDLVGQGGRIARLAPFCVGGSIAGAIVLLHTDDKQFEAVVPFLLVFAAALLAVQPRLRAHLLKRTHVARSIVFAAFPIGAAAVYGAYFGAGMGVMILAVLAICVDDTLLRANALKQLISLIVNVVGAVVFLVYGTIDWPVAGAIAGASLAGGWLGGKLASRLPESVLRWLVIGVGVVAAAIYFARL